MPTSDEARLISFDEAGFTGPRLLDEDQPYFIYASHDLLVDEARALLDDLRSRYRLQGQELKAKQLRKRGTWKFIASDICEATNRRCKFVAHNKKAALAGKFFEYFFEPVLAENSMAFYGVDFHRFTMTAVQTLLRDSQAQYSEIAEQMEAFMRTFDPASAPAIFSAAGTHAIVADRILRFCKGYAQRISAETAQLRSDGGAGGKWALDLTTTALFSLLFFHWGHRYARLRLLCDESKPLKAGEDLFNGWVDQGQSTTITDGRMDHVIRGNLASKVEFGSSATHPTIQVADLIAGVAMDWFMRPDAGNETMAGWIRMNELRSHSVDYLPAFADPRDRRVRIGREILKELAERADRAADPLDGMSEFVRRTSQRFK